MLLSTVLVVFICMQTLILVHILDKVEYLKQVSMKVHLCNYVAMQQMSHSEPKMKDLIIIVIPLLKAEWEDVAFLLNYKTHLVNSIKQFYRNDPRKCCRELFIDWLETNHGVSPKTWSTLLNTIAESEDFTKTVEQILEQLEKKLIG